jgi:hypothetical protein
MTLVGQQWVFLKFQHKNLNEEVVNIFQCS